MCIVHGRRPQSRWRYRGRSADLGIPVSLEFVSRFIDCRISPQRRLLICRPAKPILKYSVLLEWGKITRVLWVSPDVVNATSVKTFAYKNSSYESPQSLYGHLAFACTDGFLRVVPVANFSLDQLADLRDRATTICEAPLVTINPGNVLTLGISKSYLQGWDIRLLCRCYRDDHRCSDTRQRYGYPTCVDWRAAFPSKLVVGFSTGEFVRLSHGLYRLCVLALF